MKRHYRNDWRMVALGVALALVAWMIKQISLCH